MPKEKIKFYDDTVLEYLTKKIIVISKLTG
jgi:hypothetical protein